MSQTETNARAGIAGLQAVYETFTPQSGDEAWSELIITAATAGVGKLYSTVRKAAKGGRTAVKAEQKAIKKELQQAEQKAALAAQCFVAGTLVVTSRGL